MKRGLPLASAVIVVALVAALASCVTAGAVRVETTSDLVPINEHYADRYSRTSVGMSYKEAKQVWPEMNSVGESASAKTCEVKYTQIYYTTTDYALGFWITVRVPTHDYVQILRFYFEDDKLVRWGQE